MNSKYIYLAFLFAIIACDPNIDIDTTVHSGEADFSNYIAVGNSLTAGYAGNGLYAEAQLASFPNLLAGQMQMAGGGEFRQPMMPGNGSGYLYLVNTSSGPGVDAKSPDPNAFSKVAGPFNNLGIPGIRVLDIAFPGYASINPYMARILPAGQETKSYLQLVSESNPTFFTCWIGNNDVLGYAVTGGAFGLAGEPLTGLNGITPVAAFELSFEALMSIIGNKKGLIITIPDILIAPLFTTVPKTPIPLNNESAALLNQAYAGYNQGVDLYNSIPANQPKLNKIVFQQGYNYPVVEDKSIPDASGLPKFSQLTQDGFLLLTLPVEKFVEGWGTATPVPDQYVLTAAEAENIKNFTNEYNEIIRSYESPEVAILESTPILQKVADGFVLNGAPISAEFITGGIFSVDGAHLTPRGNAFLTNEAIKAINQKFHSTLPPLQVTAYPGVNFPE